MQTTIYLIRHSKPMKEEIIDVYNTDLLPVYGPKTALSIDGEKKAEAISRWVELKNIDKVYSSNYVRAVSTAKYIAHENNSCVYIHENLGERKHGIINWNQLPSDFEQRQKDEPSFKIGNGESQIEVANRMYNVIYNILNENLGKRIAIISHATAITFLFMKLGEYKNNSVYYKEKVVIPENFNWDAPEVFKLVFEDNELLSIENIRK